MKKKYLFAECQYFSFRMHFNAGLLLCI